MVTLEDDRIASMEINWQTLPDRRARFMVAQDLIDVSASQALSILFTKLCKEMLDCPNALNFDAILLRLDFWSAEIILRIGCLSGDFDGCSMRVKELDEIEAKHQLIKDQFDNDLDVEFDHDPYEVNRVARSKINLELGIELLQMVKEARSVLNAKCKSTGFRVVVFEVGEQETVIDEQFDRIGHQLNDRTNQRDDGSGPLRALGETPSDFAFNLKADETTLDAGGGWPKFPWSTMSHDGTTGHQMSKDYNYDAGNSIRRIPYDRLADFEPDFRYVEFDPLRELVDLPDTLVCPPGLIISHRFWEILRTHSLPPHQVYSLPGRKKNVDVQGYFFIHLPLIDGKMLDALTIPQAEQFLRDREDIINLDLVSIGGSTRFGYCFVSRSLKESIETAKLTGVRFGTSRLFRRPTQLD